MVVAASRFQQLSAEQLGRAAVVLVVAVVGLMCLMLAGVPPVAHLLAVAGALLALAVVLVDRHRKRRPLGVTVMVLPIAVGAALTALSLLPLPHSVRALLSPESTDRIDRLLPLLSSDAAALVRPVMAFDPPEASLALLRLLFAAVVVVVLAWGTRTRDGRLWTFRAILVVTFVVGFAVLFATAVGIPRFLDVVGVPVNPNHRARVCGALALLCLSRAATLRARIEATWFAVGGVFCALLLFTTLSKGGIAAFAVGVVVLIALVVRGKSTSLALRLGVPVAGIAMVVGGLAFVGSRAVDTLAMETFDRPERLKTFLWEPSSRVATLEPLLGVGNNGFGVAFPAVLGPGELDATLTYSHAENIVLQTLADHGVFGGGLLLLLVAGLAVVLVRALGDAGEAVAVPALAFLLVGDVFDFALETPAGLGLCALCLGLLGGRLANHRRSLVRLRLIPAIVVVIVVVATAGLTSRAAVRDWRYRLDDLIADSGGAARVQVLERALAVHPSDASYAAELAIEARRRRDPRAALRFANRSVVLWPALRAAHLEAARAFFAVGLQRQAMLEYREAWRAKSGNDIVKEVAARSPDVTLRRLAVPEPARAADLALLCNALVREKRDVDARACLREVTPLPDATPAHHRAAIELAISSFDLAAAQAGVAALPRPLDGAEAALAAQVLALSDGVEAALVSTSLWVDEAKDARPLLEWRLREQRRLKQFDDAASTIGKLRALSKTAAQATSWDLQLVGLLRERGDPAGARVALQKALVSRPRDLDLLAARFKLELAEGDVGGATATWTRMRDVSPKDRRVVEADRLLQARR